MQTGQSWMEDDTIAAVATAVGEGGIGIIRISGREALRILEEIFVPIRKHIEKPGQTAQTESFSGSNSMGKKAAFLPDSRGETIGLPIENRRLSYGMIEDESGKIIDEVMAVYMKAPYTYTTEDVVEIQCHGSVVALRKILSLVLRKGARLAEPGEFTKRAFLNGRIDLTQAEAVMELVSSKADKSFEAAFSQMSGRLSKEIGTILEDVRDVLIEITVNIDYPDEDIEELTYEKLIKSLSAIGDKLEKLIATANTGRIIKDGLKVVIAGKPNVGKSSLMNALLRESRAIVTEIAGTTRDIIEESLSIDGIPVRLCDTAGIRNTEDKVEKIGIEKSRDALDKADLVIFMLDKSADITKEDFEIAEYIKGKKVIVLLNKNDLKPVVGAEEIKKLFECQLIKVIETAADKGEGVAQLTEEIKELVYKGKLTPSENVMITNARHAKLLENSLLAIGDGLEAARACEPLDIVEIDVKNAYNLLGEITGETASADIIDEVFARFCLGK